MSNIPEEEQTIVRQPIQPVQIKQDLAKDAKEEKDQQIINSINRSHSEDSLKNKVDLANSIVAQEAEDINKPDEQQKIALIPQDFFYPQNHKEKIYDQSPIPQYVIKMDSFFGYDSFKRYNPKILDRDNIIYSSGISYTIYNHFTKEKKSFYSQQKGGIGFITISQNKKYFAVGQMGMVPNIYIYEYPSLKLYRILRKGTQKTYSCLCFSNDDNLLVTVGGDPDYLITIWEWKQQRLMLKSKAFSQDIYRVSFSQFNQNWLTTSGTGHIRFWKISETFTGLKLQGDIAKFGQFQLSDVVSYAEFQDGNVLSSSQYGKLLLWEGNVIKSVVAIDQNTPCHKGKIQYVKLHGNKVISAGQDGFIRFWDYLQINQGQSDEHFNLYVKPKKQIYFASRTGGPAHINWIDITQQFWLVQDALGSLYKFNIQTDKRQKIHEFNAGRFNDLALSPLNNCCVTAGFDGYIRLWDYGNKRQFFAKRFGTPGQSLCIQWFPFSKNNNGRMIVAGFSDGLVRFIGIGQDNFKLIKAFKVHKNPIHKLKINRQGSIVSVCDVLGNIFFLSVDSHNLQKITPYCLFQTGFKINDMCFDKNGEKLLLACQDGKIRQLNVPKQSQCNFTQTYKHQFTERSYTIKMMQSQKPNREDLELELLLKKTKGSNVDEVIVEQQWQPAPIINATYYDSECTKILCSVEGKYLGLYYIVDMSKQRPIGSIQGNKFKTSYLNYNQQADLILIGYKNGFWEVRHKYDPNIYLRKESFDQNYGIVKNISLNVQNTALIALSEDGTMITYKFDFSTFIKGAKGDSIQQSQVSIPAVVLGISQSTFADKVDFPQAAEDITNNTIYCLQDQKLKAQEDMKLTEAQKIKITKIQKIKQLQSLFKEVVQTNNNESDYLAKLAPQQLVVDPQYVQAFQRRVNEEIQQTKKQIMWDQYNAQLAKQKIQKYFINDLQFDKFTVKGIKTNNAVSSFKMNKLSPFIERQLQQIQRIIQQQKRNDRKSDKKDRTMSQFQQSRAMMEMNKLRDTKKAKEQNQQVRNKIRQAEMQFQKELQYAESTMGDYKLKSSPEYDVPQNERLNVSRKKKHLFLHYQYLFMEKKQFNIRLQGLRKLKKNMIDKLQSINQRIRSINKQLEIQQPPIFFQLDEQIELLQAQIQVTQEEIAQHINLKQKQKDAAKKTGGMGMGSNQPKQQKTQQNVIKKVRRKKVQQKKQEKVHIQAIYRKNMKVKKSVLEDQYKQIKKIELSAQKNRIIKQLNQEIQNFDEQLNDLRIYKYQLQNDLTLVEMKLLTFSQQFIIFRDMEAYDNQLMTSLTTYSTEKSNLQSNFISLSTEISQLEAMNDQLRKKFQDQKKILKEFVYPEDDQMREKIIRYYKIRERKRIQKLKKQAQIQEKQKQSDEQDQDEDQQQESEQSQQSEDEFEDDQEKPDINIIENDHKNFERVRKICQYDQKIQQNSKKKSDLEKQRNQITNKIKNIDNELTKADKQLKIYQKKKLLKINQLYVSLPIKFSQCQYLVKMNGKLKIQEDFSSAILFTHSAFKKLGERIDQLKKQKSDIQKKQIKLNKKLIKLTEEVSKSSVQIQNRRKEYEEKQLLKFGSTFELQRLNQLQPNFQVKQMRQLYKKEQKQASKKIQQIKQDLQQRKRQLLQAKRQNTKVITQITELGNKQNELKKKLDSTNKQLFKNYDVSKKDQLQKERQNLKDLIKFLSKEIQDLKTQIGLFKRKGGHIYTMVTSNKKNFS